MTEQGRSFAPAHPLTPKSNFIRRHKTATKRASVFNGLESLEHTGVQECPQTIIATVSYLSPEDLISSVMS